MRSIRRGACIARRTSTLKKERREGGREGGREVRDGRRASMEEGNDVPRTFFFRRGPQDGGSGA
jgi:hypothetical protein